MDRTSLTTASGETHHQSPHNCKALRNNSFNVTHGSEARPGSERWSIINGQTVLAISIVIMWFAGASKQAPRHPAMAFGAIGADIQREQTQETERPRSRTRGRTETEMQGNGSLWDGNSDECICSQDLS